VCGYGAGREQIGRFVRAVLERRVDEDQVGEVAGCLHDGFERRARDYDAKTASLQLPQAACARIRVCVCDEDERNYMLIRLGCLQFRHAGTPLSVRVAAQQERCPPPNTQVGDLPPSASNESIDHDAGDGAERERTRVVTQLILRIEHKEKQPADERTADCVTDDFERHETLPLRAAVPVGERSLTAGTGRHGVRGNSIPAELLCTPFGVS